MPHLRFIPSIDRVLGQPGVVALIRTYGHDRVVLAARRATDGIRVLAATDHDAPSTSDAALAWIEARLIDDLNASIAPSLRRVINATGVILHTNLGRAPLAPAAIARLVAIASGYSNLEYDLAAGSRGRRDVHAEHLLRSLTGAEAAVVMNNNAATMLVTLAALAAGREVIVSRGELVEIGGGFRVPDILAQSGAVLREVGTTNRTRAADYAAAISDRTALILRVHPSNFRIDGFTERPTLPQLAAVGQQFGLPVVEDLGSGWLGGITVEGHALRDEPTVAASLNDGADLVAFSGDKLLGGPQAGVLVGRSALLDRVRRHPLMRAVRADKLTYAALEATLEIWMTSGVDVGRDSSSGLRVFSRPDLESPPRSTPAIPVLRMMTMTADTIGVRARTLANALSALPGVHVEIIDGVSTTGGGSAPSSQIPTRLVAVTSETMSAEAIDTRLRTGDPAVVARIANDRVVFDLRTVAEREANELAGAIRQALTESRPDV
jgi:L-seryl-tRNA(Ser) seleniumtransferase